MRSRASSATGTWAEVRERILVWAHVLLVAGFLAYLPHSKHLHIATAAINVWFGRTRSRGRLEPLDFDVEDESAMRFGAATVADMTWKQMVDTMSCTECGRCQDVCPAYATGKELSPKLLIMGLRDQLFAEGPQPARRRRRSSRPRSCRTPSPTTWSGTASRAAPACRSARSRSSTSTTSSTCAATSSWSSRASRPRPRRCSATSSARRTRGGSRRPSGPTGPRVSTCACCSPASRRPRCSTGSAAPRRSTSARG